MKLLTELQETAEELDSIVQLQLRREDIKRVEQLEALGREAASFAEFEKAATFLQWTPNDLRTSELLGTLQPFLMAFYEARGAEPSSDIHNRVRTTWIDFNRDRISKLVGCL